VNESEYEELKRLLDDLRRQAGRDE
jgi:hypothetical protein